jgi:cystathionine beta-lyase
LYEADVLPMWVADMDFRSPDCVTEAIVERVQSHSVFGYHFEHAPLREVLTERMQTRYGWQVEAGQLVFLPSLVVGLNLMCQLYGGGAGADVATFAPIYPPFLGAPKNYGQTPSQAPMRVERVGSRLEVSIDWDAFEACITPKTRLLMLCHPHNPLGYQYSRADLERILALAERHDLTVVSDEIHCDLILGDQPHIPFASIAPEAAARTVTLMAPSKTFNVPGLGLGFAIIQDPERLKALTAAMWSGMVAHTGVVGLVGAEAAYRHGQPWLSAALAQIRRNRDAAVAFFADTVPEVACTVPSATFLMWLDFRQTALADDPYKLLIERGRVALNNGKDFGLGGEGFARLNFACPPATLQDGLGRIARAVRGG